MLYYVSVNWNWNLNWPRNDNGVVTRNLKVKTNLRGSMEKQVKSVITRINASNCLDLSISIDKVIYRLSPYTTGKELITYLENKKIEYNKSRLKNAYCISVGKFYFLYLHNTKEIIAKLVTNPNDFDSYSDYTKFYNQVCSGLKLKLEPCRVDVALDMNKDFKWLNKRISIGRKRTLTRYVLDGCKEQTRYFGKAPNELTLYDRGEKSKKLKGCRLESRKSGASQIASKSLDSLEKELVSSSFNPFENVEIIDFKLKKFSELGKNLKLILKLEQIKTLLPHNGYFYTRKYFNKNRNFKRDFKSFVKEVSNTNLGDLYLPLMKSYLGHGGSDD